MREQEKERIQSDILSKEKDVSDYENKINEINEKLQAIEQTLGSIADDNSVSKIIENVEQQREKEKLDEERNANLLREELMGLLKDLEEIQQSDLQTKSILNDLMNIGENVSEASEVLQNRESWLEESKSKVIALLERLKGMSITDIPRGKSFSVLGGKPDLSKTNQVIKNQMMDGKEVLVFDTPQESAKNAVINQGQAYPGIMGGTCGLCSSATIMRKAGFDVDEKKIIDYSVRTDNQFHMPLCKPDGSTNFIYRAILLQSMCGIETTAEVIPLEEVAKKVETGHGAIIGVNACLYAPEWYGRYDPNESAGHALVLDSVVREKSSQKIVGYYVIDSNGHTSSESCRYVSADQLTRGYEKHGSRANITKNIIW